MGIRMGMSGWGRLIFSSFLLFQAASSGATMVGTVKDGSGNAIVGATVQLVVINKSTQTDAAGNWAIDVSSSIRNQAVRSESFSATLKEGLLALTINKPRLRVKISLHKLDGSLLDWVFDKNLAAGSYTINPVRQSLPPQWVLIQADIGGTVTSFRLPMVAGAPPVPLLPAWL